MNKRGISPLIATVLLISFVVILSGVIMFWGRQFVTELMEKKGEVALAKSECVTGVDMDIIGVEGNFISIRNTGSIRLSGFYLKYPNEPPCEIIQSVNSYEDTKIDLRQCPLGSGTQVNIIPVMKPSGIGAPSIPCSTKNKVVKLGR